MSRSKEEPYIGSSECSLASSSNIYFCDKKPVSPRVTSPIVPSAFRAGMYFWPSITDIVGSLEPTIRARTSARGATKSCPHSGR